MAKDQTQTKFILAKGKNKKTIKDEDGNDKLIEIINAKQFVADCKEAGLDPKKTVLVWPTNTGHHQNPAQKLYGGSGGKGLGYLAQDLIDKDYPTLGLPTTLMKNLDHKVDGNHPAPDMARDAVADLWKAVGFGCSLYLPTREQIDTTYFSEKLKGVDGQGREPSFWGGVEAKANKHLADYYLEQIELLRKFMALDNDARAAAIQAMKIDGTSIPKEFCEAYQSGVDALKDNNKTGFFAPTSKSEVKSHHRKSHSTHSLLGSGQRETIKTVMSQQGFTCHKDSGAQGLGFSKKAGKETLSFNVTPDKVSANNTQNMSDEAKKTLAEAMVKAFKAGLPPGQSSYSLNSTDQVLRGYIEAAAKAEGLVNINAPKPKTLLEQVDLPLNLDDENDNRKLKEVLEEDQEEAFNLNKFN